MTTTTAFLPALLSTVRLASGRRREVAGPPPRWGLAADTVSLLPPRHSLPSASAAARSAAAPLVATAATAGNGADHGGGGDDGDDSDDELDDLSVPVVSLDLLAVRAATVVAATSPRGGGNRIGGGSSSGGGSSGGGGGGGGGVGQSLLVGPIPPGIPWLFSQIWADAGVAGWAVATLNAARSLPPGEVWYTGRGVGRRAKAILGARVGVVVGGNAAGGVDPDLANLQAAAAAVAARPPRGGGRDAKRPGRGGGRRASSSSPGGEGTAVGRVRVLLRMGADPSAPTRGGVGGGGGGGGGGGDGGGSGGDGGSATAAVVDLAAAVSRECPHLDVVGLAVGAGVAVADAVSARRAVADVTGGRVRSLRLVVPLSVEVMAASAVAASAAAAADDDDDDDDDDDEDEDHDEDHDDDNDNDNDEDDEDGDGLGEGDDDASAYGPATGRHALARSIGEAAAVTLHAWAGVPGVTYLVAPGFEGV
ncbi:hypothetical protein MMPV_005090 [Pyropia vietnamensis]